MSGPVRRAALNGAISGAIRAGTRAMQAIYGRRYARAKAKGEPFYVDDLPIAPTLPPEQTATAHPTVPPGPARPAHPFKARVTTQG